MLASSASFRWKRGASAPRVKRNPGRPLGLGRCFAATLLIAAAVALTAQTSARFNGARAYEYAKELVAFGPRYNGSEGLAKAQAWLRKQFSKDDLVEDTFVADTPAGPQALHNFVVKFPGKKDGIIVLATHYETNYPLRDTSFVGANDGASTTGLLLDIANRLRAERAAGGGKPRDGYSVWLVFFDGEEAVKSWSASDSLYGSRHAAAKWANDGTLKRIKALLLADMIGDKDLDILRESSSTPWLTELVRQAAAKEGDQRYFFRSAGAEEDDHQPFLQRGVPAIDIIDVDYGPHDAAHPDGYHHTPEDTLDKISAKSLTIDGDVFLEAIRLLDSR
jgi:Zn-dependent M28 family amino/carboxypeptidase